MRESNAAVAKEFSKEAQLAKCVNESDIRPNSIISLWNSQYLILGSGSKSEENSNDEVLRFQENSQKHVAEYNGFGSFEDSLQNCLRISPKTPKKDLKRFLSFSRNGMEGNVLRFCAVNAKMAPIMISVFLEDDTIKVCELQKDFSLTSPSKIFIFYL
ncbi:MAG: EF-hand domain-containing member C2 [Paramarteilia canceri]